VIPSPSISTQPPLALAAADPIDLHLHTLASDGFWTPAALIDHLAGRGFKVAAVCDHDTQRSVLEAMRLGAERGIRVIPGVEMTCGWIDRQWHVLIYGVAPDREDPESAAFRACLTDIDNALQELAHDARRRIEESGRALPSLEELRAGRPLWPFHVLSSAIRENHVKNLKEAAELVVELGGRFTTELPLERVVDAARQAGGTAVMAHPGRADAVGIMTEEHLDRMRAEGIAIEGLEAHYRSYTDAQTTLYRTMAEARGMVVSCGSDSHAPNMPVDPRPWRAVWAEELLARFGVQVERDDDAPVWQEGSDPLAAQPEPEATPDEADAVTAGATI
jgi:hypothetical protein